MGDVTKEIMGESSDFFPIKPMDYRRLLVISLGTDSKKEEGKYSAKCAAKRGILGWLSSPGGTPLVDTFMQASSDMVNYHLSSVFQALHIAENCLRIQVHEFTRGWYTSSLLHKELYFALTVVDDVRKPIFCHRMTH